MSRLSESKRIVKRSNMMVAITLILMSALHLCQAYPVVFEMRGESREVRSC